MRISLMSTAKIINFVAEFMSIILKLNPLSYMIRFLKNHVRFESLSPSESSRSLNHANVNNLLEFKIVIN